MKPDSI